MRQMRLKSKIDFLSFQFRYIIDQLNYKCDFKWMNNIYKYFRYLLNTKKHPIRQLLPFVLFKNKIHINIQIEKYNTNKRNITEIW